MPCRGGGACAGVDDYDWPDLSRSLGLIKDEYPDDWSVIVVPEAEVPYEVLVRALDCARWAPWLPLDAELDGWERWQEQRRSLFPLPTLAGGAP